MHFVNKLLYSLGIQVYKSKTGIPRQFITTFNRQFEQLKKDNHGFKIYKGLRYEFGSHPMDSTDFQCGFAAKHINRVKPQTILDIGSYRYFIIGLLSHYQVTTLDVREREPITTNETAVTSDVTKLKTPDNYFDVVVSLCALEHFGLGRYGDEFDIEADVKGLKEMVRTLKPGGRLILSTTISGAKPAIIFNAERVYDRDMIYKYHKGLKNEYETYYSNKYRRECTFDEISMNPEKSDYYCGCWIKP